MFGLCFLPSEMFLLNSLLVINMLIKVIMVRIISLITCRIEAHREKAGWTTGFNAVLTSSSIIEIGREK
jgi:hypothetical protein